MYIKSPVTNIGPHAIKTASEEQRFERHTRITNGFLDKHTAVSNGRIKSFSTTGDQKNGYPYKVILR